MFIVDNPKVIFIHIPKTAGTSIQHVLKMYQPYVHKYCLNNTKHETVQSLVNRIGIGEFIKYFSFSVVRHPLDRFVSHYRYLKSNPNIFPEMIVISSLEQYVDAIEVNDTNVITKKERVMPQNDYLKFNGVISVNKIIHFENLHADLYKLFDGFSIKISELPKLNASEILKPAVSDCVKSFVNRYYSEDFSLLGY